MRSFNSALSKAEVIISVFLLCAFCIYFLPTPHQEIRIHDTFDGNFSTRHALVHSGEFWQTSPAATVPGIMNGLPRGVFPKFTEITSLLMYCFGSLNGFMIGFLLVRLIGFAGIWLFGKDHLNVAPEQKGILFLVALCFACLPVFVIHGLTVMGIPLVLWAFFNIQKKQNMAASLFVFVIFPLWSNFVLVGLHILFILGILFLYFSMLQKRIGWRLLGAIVLMLFVYVLSEYMLFYLHYFDKDYHSSRGEFEKTLGLNLKGVIGGTFKNLFTGDYSAANYFGYLLIPFMICFGWFSIRQRKSEEGRLGLLFLCIILFSAFMISLLDWKSFAFFYEKFRFAKVFNFKRFTNTLPGFFFITALLSLLWTSKKSGALVRISCTVALLILFVFMWRGNISHNRSAFNTTGLHIISEQQITFDQFFDPQLYARIKKEIGSDTLANVIHFGISPSPSKYAGLNVLDDYQGDFPVEYKMQFRKIIAGELEKSPPLKNYFDGWGARCYMESANSFNGTLVQKDGFTTEPQLDIDIQQLKNMKCGYILSSIVIGNAAQLGLSKPKAIVSRIGDKTIFLYKII